ncbi:MAG: hypothetical protein IKY54_06910 [Muribaculaceae bacterium]|nr:hypothetical protein [Muribaculaceae bacterium]
MMRRGLFLSLFIFFSLSILSVNADNKIRTKADEHFSKNEWKEASEIYNILINSEKNNTSLYAPSIISAGKCNNFNRVMEYITFSEKCGIPLDSIFRNTLSLSLKVRSTDVYETTLLTIKERQPWLKNLINGYLLEFYNIRKNSLKTIDIANSIIESNPKNVTEIMCIKANALNDIGDINSAIEVMEGILKIDENNIDARLFLGNYFFISAKQSIKEGNFTVKIPSKKGKGKEDIKYINTDIYSALKRAKIYLDVEYLTDKRPYVQNIVKEIDSMIKAFEEPIKEN